jgi:hypothetical protein
MSDVGPEHGLVTATRSLYDRFIEHTASTETTNSIAQ